MGLESPEKPQTMRTLRLGSSQYRPLMGSQRLDH